VKELACSNSRGSRCPGTRFAHFPLTDLVPTVKDFVKFLKKHPSAFAFSSQDCLSSEPPEPP